MAATMIITVMAMKVVTIRMMILMVMIIKMIVEII